MTFKTFLDNLKTMNLEPVGARRNYWHYSVIKSGEMEYTLLYRDKELAICKDLPSAVLILNASFRTIRIEYDQ